MTHHITYSTKRCCGVYHGLLNYSNLVIREYIDLMYANALLHFNAFHKKPLKQRETLLRHLESSRYQEIPLYRHLTKTTHIILPHFSFKVSITIQCWSMKSYALTMKVDSVLRSSVWYSNTILIQWLYIVTLSKY